MCVSMMRIFAGNNGEACLPDGICNDANAVCIQATTCTCDQANGYVDKAGLCRKQSMYIPVLGGHMKQVKPVLSDHIKQDIILAFSDR